jgi:hypothetical protein
MKIDFHTHGKLAKKLPFSPDYTKWLFKEAYRLGLDALCLTEHFNTLEFERLYGFLSENYPTEGDSLLVEGVRVFPGIEVDIREGAHTLFIGTLENILSFHKQLIPYQKKDAFIDLKSLLTLAAGYDFIKGGAHPFREGSNLPILPRELLLKFDFMDLNGKDYATKGAFAKEELLGLANSLDLPIVAGSDTHQSFQYGCIWNHFHKDCTTILQLKEAIQSNAYEIEVAPTASFKVETASLLKKALKEVHALGGDYVSLLL